TFYGKSHILREASLCVREREIVALLGRNGAGKSTLLKSIIGIARAADGRITLGDIDLRERPAAEIARLGIGYVPQGRGLFAGMSVRDNLELGRLKRRSGDGVAWNDEKILEFFPQLKLRLDTPADFLSGGEQQMVAVARALSGQVRVLLLDEPFEGLAPAVIEELFEAFDRLRGEVAMMIVEHNLDLVLALADRAYVLERGSVVHEGTATALREDLALRGGVLWMGPDGKDSGNHRRRTDRQVVGDGLRPRRLAGAALRHRRSAARRGGDVHCFKPRRAGGPRTRRRFRRGVRTHRVRDRCCRNGVRRALGAGKPAGDARAKEGDIRGARSPHARDGGFGELDVGDSCVALHRRVGRARALYRRASGESASSRAGRRALRFPLDAARNNHAR